MATEAEEHFDLLVAERRRAGRKTYGKGLTHADPYDWNQMALEEALDLAQYLAAENLRLREERGDALSRAKASDEEAETIHAAIDGEPWAAAVLKHERDVAREDLRVAREDAARLLEERNDSWRQCENQHRHIVAIVKERDDALAEVERLREAVRKAWQERDQSRDELAKLKELVASCVRNCMECSYAHECQTCYWVRTSGIKLEDE